MTNDNNQKETPQMKIQPTKKQQAEIMADLASIAREALDVPTLEEAGNDSLDFHDCGVLRIRAALEAAYMAGRKDAMRQASEITANTPQR